MIDWLMDGWFDWLISWLIVWLNDWLIGCLVGCLVVGWLTDWLLDWLIDWLVDWSTDQLTHLWRWQWLLTITVMMVMPIMLCSVAKDSSSPLVLKLTLHSLMSHWQPDMSFITDDHLAHDNTGTCRAPTTRPSVTQLIGTQRELIFCFRF